MYNITFVKYWRILPTNVIIKKVDGTDYEHIITHSLEKKQCAEAAVYLNGEIYLFGISTKDRICVQSYSLLTNTLTDPMIANFRLEHTSFYACAFMQNIYVIGGCLFDLETGAQAGSDVCWEFNVKTKMWKEIAKMNIGRMRFAVTVFQGQIVVSGGWDYHGAFATKWVEAYDHAADEWSHMPDMILGRRHHSLVATRSKLIAIGYNPHPEIYDRLFDKFVEMKPIPPSFDSFDFVKAISIGGKLQLFENNSKVMATYDVNEDKWSVEPFTATKDDWCDICLKIPKI